ncbi:hypothetical protein V8G54_036035 [Vigna mungo]|uniref:Uncharacterized protein n=1 Tax=Vigna mungo TaxID=3915 RepID=A0AAQ3RDY2_VIGMU
MEKIEVDADKLKDKGSDQLLAQIDEDKENEDVDNDKSGGSSEPTQVTHEMSTPTDYSSGKNTPLGGQIRGVDTLAWTPRGFVIRGKPPSGGPLAPGGYAIRGKPPDAISVTPGGCHLGLGLFSVALLSYK